MTYEEILGRLNGVRRRSAHKAQALCPAHEDKNPSLSVDCAEDGRVLLQCHAGCMFDDVLAAAELTKSDLAPLRVSNPNAEISYGYEDEKSALLFQVVRRPGKQFCQRRPDGKGGWSYKLDGVRRVPYHLPEILGADPSRIIVVVEGEKDADNLRAMGEIATTNPGGTGSGKLWGTPSFRDPFRGRNVVILPDNDDPGQKHATRVAHALHGHAKSVKVLNLPDLPAKGDVSDWIEDGGTREELAAFVAACPVWTPVTSGPEAEAQEDPDEKTSLQKKSQTQRLLEVASNSIDLFRTPVGEPFASITRNGVQETWPLDSEEFRLRLRQTFYEAEGASASRNALADAVEELKAKASFGSNIVSVALRTVTLADEVFHDLGQADWRVARISASGWEVVPASRCPVRFRRSGTTLPLPIPATGGQIDDLRFFVNASTDDAFQMLVAWITFGIAGGGPYPVLVVQGEQGSSKSTTTRNVASLVDPSDADLMIPPLTDEDLMIAANSCFVLAYDNLSLLNYRLSDGLSRVATGAAFTARKKYTDKGLSVMRVRRPVILNGIDELATRHDLADRSIVVHLPAIPPDKRRLESEIVRGFEEHKARILGAIYDAIAGTLKELPNVKEVALPRMADFGKWGVALERSQGWPAGSFLRAYGANLKESAASAADAEPVFLGLMDLMDRHPDGWEGTMQDLRTDLERLVPERDRGRNWPGSPRILSDRLTRLAQALRREGWERRALERGKRGKRYSIERVPGHSGKGSSPSSPSPQREGISGVSCDERSDEPGDDLRGAPPCFSKSVTKSDEGTGSQTGFVTLPRPSVGDEGDVGDGLPPLSIEREERGSDLDALPSPTGGQS